MKLEKIKDEAEIATVTKVFLELKGWKLYPEVVIDLFNGRPDYIGVKDGTLCQVVECKKSLSYPVIEQLVRWHIDAEKRLVWQQRHSYKGEIAIPHLLCAFTERGSGALSELKKRILGEYRIGVYSISKRGNRRTLHRSDQPFFCTTNETYWNLVIGDYEYEIREEIAPRIQHGSRRTAHKIIDSLKDDMCKAVAGVKAGKSGHMTPFKRTMKRVESILSDGKERHIQHIIDELAGVGGHHYGSDSSAASSIPKFIDKFKIAERSRDWGAWFVVRNDKEASHD